MRMLTDDLHIFDCEPHNELLGNRSWNEAFCTAHPGEKYAVFFPDGGDVLLDVTAMGDHQLTIRWLDIRASRWSEPVQVEADQGGLRLQTPQEEGYWAVIVRRME